MDISEFFKVRMRNQCSVRECDAATEWRESIEEVFYDTVALDWEIATQVNPSKPKYTGSAGGNITLTGMGAGSGAGGAVNITAGNVGNTATAVIDDDSSAVVFDTKMLEISLGTIRMEFVGTRWYCKDCAYQIKLKNLLT